MKILIVDDSRLNRVLLTGLLVKLDGIETSQITEACNGQQALDCVVSAYEREEPFSVVLLDIKMPVMDGLNCLEGIRLYEQGLGLASGLKVIMASALGDSKHVDSAFNAGCNHFLAKPINIDHLKSAFQQHGLHFQSWVAFLNRSADAEDQKVTAT